MRSSNSKDGGHKPTAISCVSPVLLTTLKAPGIPDTGVYTSHSLVVKTNIDENVQRNGRRYRPWSVWLFDRPACDCLQLVPEIAEWTRVAYVDLDSGCSVNDALVLHLRFRQSKPIS
jgi:hypothetical protein